MSKRKDDVGVPERTSRALYELLKTKPLEDITIVELTKKADIARVSFYRNFADKEDVLRKDMKRITETFMRKSDLRYWETEPTKFIETLFQHLLDHREKIQILVDTGLVHYLQDEFNRAFIHPDGMKSQKYIDCLVAGACYNLAYFWFDGGWAETPQQLAQIVVPRIRFA